MKELVLGLLLGVQGYIDFRNKEIPLWISILGAGVGVGFCIVEGREWMQVFISCLPGTLALLFSKLTREVIGYGDSILFLVMGIYLPVENLLSIGMLAFGIAGIVALVLLVIFRKRGCEEMAFVPFLSVAYVLDYLISMGVRGL